MKEATKKQMVDFVNSHCRIRGKKIPKNRLQQCTKEQLMEIINSDRRITSAFSEYVEQDNAKRECAVPTTNIKKDTGSCNSPKTEEHSAMVSQEKTQELQELVDAFVKDPTSFMEALQLGEFIDNLPYGSVEQDTLNTMIDRIQVVSPTMALKLLNYYVDQRLHFQ